MKETCRICGDVVRSHERRVLADGRAQLVYCSSACLRVGVRVLQMAQRKARWRRLLFVVATALALTGAGYVRHLVRRPHPPRAEVALPPPPVVQPLEPLPFGPAWPPTDEEWLQQLTRSAWTYPLPGPLRRRPVAVARIPIVTAGARCRTSGHCGVHLGGELWGEHVYAAHDGVIDRLQRSAPDEPGGFYVRISHFGGLVFTQYFHLAAIPTRLAVGMHVSAGDVIGLVGDTGGEEPGARLHFTLSIRPASALPEVYWDPQPLMGDWPLETPARGSVTGLVSLDGPSERVSGTPSVLLHHVTR